MEDEVLTQSGRHLHPNSMMVMPTSIFPDKNLQYTSLPSFVIIEPSQKADTHVLPKSDAIEEIFDQIDGPATSENGDEFDSILNSTDNHLSSTPEPFDLTPFENYFPVTSPISPADDFEF